MNGIKLGPQAVLSHEVIGCIGNNSICLCLPHKLCLIHPVFHISQIKPSTPNQFPDQQLPPPEPIEIDGELEYKLCEILDSKYDLCCWSTCELFYYIQWMGYEGTDKEYQWTTATNLTHADKLIEEFHQCYPTKPSPDIFAPDHDDHVAH